ncbi:MAG: carbamoyltransferase [Gemmatimonadales bacterium]|nr:MAG: carbamoyltransferase [Gemmatimonadales bacterium]
MRAVGSFPSCRALRISVTGVVQGVGFRPFVHRLAARHGLVGWVRNTAGEVEIQIEGPPEEMQAFLRELVDAPPPLARIAKVTAVPSIYGGHQEFAILISSEDSSRRQAVPPDVALCPACENELFDRASRRYRYPFITCTDCGPRFTVIESLPYDRHRTTMRVFPQCPRCLDEYHTPGNRRFHCETNSCPECGPALWLEAADGTVLTPEAAHRAAGQEAAIRKAGELLRAGMILAIRGLGGFHLAVDATNNQAVQLLRRRKRRDSKPFAVMVASVSEAAGLAEVGPAEASLLISEERPIVLLRRRKQTPLAEAIAPGLDTVGIMIAYTPLHRLVLEEVQRPLVMTSGNLTDEPIVATNEAARERLAQIADFLLLHNRPISARCDDSVVRVVMEKPVFLRRARGYAPLPLELPIAASTAIIAVGADLKNTFTLADGSEAWVSPHIGDLEKLETVEHFQQTLQTYRRLFRIDPELAVRDLHPGYISTFLAHELPVARIWAVQHHHAHIAAVMAEHGLSEPVIGLAFDGTGYGDDGQIWGGEVLLADLRSYRRLGHLRYAPLPGGDSAVRQPWRAALGLLSLEPSATFARQRTLARIPSPERSLAEVQLRENLNSPLTSSMGRLFDAAAAILGVRQIAHYEGQAAMELEALARDRGAEPLPFPVIWSSGEWILDPIPLLVALAEKAARGEALADLAAAFHESIAATAAAVAEAACSAHSVNRVALGGGVFQNARLLASVTERLRSLGLEVLWPVRLSPNDGAISYGQAAVAAARLFWGGE